MKTHKNGKVYVLYGVVPNDILYVGCTSDTFQRYRSHVKLLKNGEDPIYVYLRDNGLGINMMVIEEHVDIEDKYLKQSEEYWIDQFRQWGFLIKNVRHNLSNRKEKRADRSKDQYESISNVEEIDRLINEKEYLAFTDVLSEAGVSKSTLSRMIKADKIRHVVVGMHRLYNIKDVIDNKQ